MKMKWTPRGKVKIWWTIQVIMKLLNVHDVRMLFWYMLCLATRRLKGWEIKSIQICIDQSLGNQTNNLLSNFLMSFIDVQQLLIFDFIYVRRGPANLVEKSHKMMPAVINKDFINSSFPFSFKTVKWKTITLPYFIESHFS